MADAKKAEEVISSKSDQNQRITAETLFQDQAAAVLSTDSVDKIHGIREKRYARSKPSMQS